MQNRKADKDPARLVGKDDNQGTRKPFINIHQIPKTAQGEVTMKWMQFLLPILVLTGLCLPVQAQIFTRKPRLTNVQVPELIVTSKTDQDERKRLAAVEQLREFDSKNHPEIVPVLIDVLFNDVKSGVRLEAVNSLAKIRPVSQIAGQALEVAAQRDDNWRVRWQAKTSLWGYQMAGYRGTGAKDGQFVAPSGPSTKEPPLGGGVLEVIESPASIVPLPGTSTTGPVLVPVNPVPGELLVNPSPVSTRPLPQGSSVSLPRPLPSRPTPGFTTATPQQPPPVPPPSNEGPIIVPLP
jgi:hypothetical protein